ncbi:MAG: thioredoxin family protein [Phreatobacter sp.]|uniref:thioredoxin family protein n=1 Tax=Phreatobacter sp. TaxID=1966341 RepID=UPI001A4C8CF9|nr:thioredoxin family protein [Phreatobacter sp.]MBL8569321.1 thioredoxin family protein [Phreatobacter sp.]
MTGEVSICGRVEMLRESAFDPFLAASREPVLVVLSTDWSPACRLLRPVVARLAMALADAVCVVALDGEEALGFRQRYGVDAVPQLLAFDKRRLIGRLAMPDDARSVAQWVAETFRRVSPETPADRLFEAAWSRARRTYDDIIAPARNAVAPHLDAAGRQMEAFERRMAEERHAGLISDEQEMVRRGAEFERVFAPFRHEMGALEAAEAAALAAYEDLMLEALDEYGAHRGRCELPEVTA